MTPGSSDVEGNQGIAVISSPPGGESAVVLGVQVPPRTQQVGPAGAGPIVGADPPRTRSL